MTHLLQPLHILGWPYCQYHSLQLHRFWRAFPYQPGLLAVQLATMLAYYLEWRLNMGQYRGLNRKTRWHDADELENIYQILWTPTSTSRFQSLKDFWQNSFWVTSLRQSSNIVLPAFLVMCKIASFEPRHHSLRVFWTKQLLTWGENRTVQWHGGNTQTFKPIHVPCRARTAS